MASGSLLTECNSKKRHMPSKPSFLSVSFRHGAGVVLALGVNVVCAANLPTFTFTQPGVLINAIAVDLKGNTYLAGYTDSANIPVTEGAFQTQFTGGICLTSGSWQFPNPCDHAFVIKLDPSGAIVFATYLAGNSNDSAWGVSVDAAQNVYVAGVTTSANFPVTPGAAFTTPMPYNELEGFIVKLNPAGSQMVYGTFLPGADLMALAIDGAGNAYVTGLSGGVTPYLFPTTAGAFQTAPKNVDSISAGVVAKLNASGSALVDATYLSGSGESYQGDVPLAISVDSSGDAVIAGYTGSTDFPVTPGAFQSSIPSQVSAFATKLNPDGTALIFSTYLGASKDATIPRRLTRKGARTLRARRKGAIC
jgi:hypothetical protein